MVLKNRNLSFGMLGLGLVILACTCAPMETIQQAQDAAATAQKLQQQAQELQQTAGPLLTSLPTFQSQYDSFSLTATQVFGGIQYDSTALFGTAVALQGGASGRQWAVIATATSAFGDPSWSAAQAAGTPNTPDCGDYGTAWASASGIGLDTLTLKYGIPVVPTSIEIHHSYNPGSVISVMVTTTAGQAVTVYQAYPAAINQCPFIQIIPVTGVTDPIDTIAITVDQSVIGNWDEIDAVGLLGN